MLLDILLYSLRVVSNGTIWFYLDGSMFCEVEVQLWYNKCEWLLVVFGFLNSVKRNYGYHSRPVARIT